MSLTDKQQKFVDTFLEFVESGITEKEARLMAKREAGYAETTLYRHIFVEEVKQAIIEGTNLRLVTLLPKAVNKIDSVLDNPEQGGAARLLEAAAQVLDRGGVVKKEAREVTIKAPTGIVIIPSKKPLDEPAIN